MALAVLFSLIFSLNESIFFHGIVYNSNFFAYFTMNLLAGMLCKVVYLVSEKRKVRYAIWYGGCSLFSVICCKHIINGGKIIASYIITAMNRYYGTSMGVFTKEQQSLSVLLCVLLLFILVLPHLLWGEYRPVKWWLCVESAAVCMAVGLLLGKAPKAGALVLLVLALMGYRIYGNSLAFHGGKAVTIIRYVCLVMAVAVIAGTGMNVMIVKHHDSLLRFQKKLERDFHLFDISGYCDGRLSNRTPKKTHELMMTVTSNEDIYDNVYFPGFTGGDYVKGQWTALDETAYYKAVTGKEDAKKDVSVQLDSYAGKALNFFGNRYQKMAITYNGVKDSYAYIPYFSNFKDIDNQLEENGDGKYRRVSNDTILVSSHATTSEYLLDEIWIGEMYKEQSNIGQEINDIKIPYAEYVKDNYLTVPEDLKEKLLALLGDDVSRVKSDISIIPKLLDEQAEYSLELDNLKWGEDYVEHFLFEEKKGYCSHFATAATLLYRCAGIPARYVSGYVAQPANVEEERIMEYTVKLTDDDAHSWTEIYVDEYGWMPVEVTPGYYQEYDEYADIMQTEDDYYAFEQEEEGQVLEQKKKAQDVTTQSQNATEQPQSEQMHKEGTKTENEQNPLAPILNVVIKIGIVVVLCSMLFICKRRWNYARRHHKNADLAVTAVKKQLVRYFKRMGYRRKKEETEKAYFLCAATALWDNHEQEEIVIKEDKALIKKVWDILEKQAYSRQALVECDVKACNQLFDCLVKRKFQ